MNAERTREVLAHYKTCLVLFARLNCQDAHEFSISDRIIAEAILYHCATQTLFDQRMCLISTHELQSSTAPAMKQEIFPGVSEAYNRPVLGLPPVFYFTMHELSHLCHRRPLSAVDRTTLQTLEERLLGLQNSVVATPAEALGVVGSLLPEYVRLGRLYCLAGLMLAARLQVASLSALESDSFFTSYRQEAIRLIDVKSMVETHGSYDTTWPVVVVGSLCSNLQDIFLVREAMLTLTTRLGEENDKRLWTVLEEIWRRRPKTISSPDNGRRQSYEDVDELALLAACYNNS